MRRTMMYLLGAILTVTVWSQDKPPVVKSDPATLTEVEQLRLQTVSMAAENLALTYHIKEYQEQQKKLADQFKQLVDAINKAHPGYTLNEQTGKLEKAADKPAK